MPRPLVLGMAVTAALAAAPAAPAARADTVVLVDGKRLEGVVCRDDDEGVVLNPWNSRCPDMTWEIPDKCRIPRAKVKEVIVGDAPLVEARRRAATPGLSADDRRALIDLCRKHKLEEEAKAQERLLRAQELAAAAEDGAAEPSLPAGVKGDPDVDPVLRRLEREYLGLKDAAALDAQWKLMQERGTTRPRTWLERARRSAAQPKGRRDRVPLTVRAKDAPGATYCVFVPSRYDPLVPTPLVIGLHGGGAGGKDPKLVTGSGESAMAFYEDVAEEWGWLVACPTALAAGWSSKENEPVVDGVVEEMRLLFHVDETRIYLTGHSMGGFGAWHWGPARADLWAAIAPCAGGGGPGGVDALGLPTYVFHGADDAIVPPDHDRSAAKALGGGKKKCDFVYTELNGVGHGFPDWVRRDVFRFFAGRMKDRGKKRATEPASSFARKVEKEEVRAFGDPSAAPSSGDGGDAKLADLVARLQRGGGASVEAAAELGARKDAATAKAVAAVLRSRKQNVDVRVAAATALGGIGGPEAVKALAAETADEDFRVVDEVVASLGRIGGAATADALLRASKTMAAFFDAGFSGDAIDFTEYEVRCRSFGRLAQALGASGQADAAVAALERDVVQRVFTPRTPYRVPIDDRFVEIPPRARLDLVRALRAAFVALKAPRGAELLASIRAAWASEPAIAAECDAGVAELR